MRNVLLWLGPISTDIIVPSKKELESGVLPVLPPDWTVKTYNRGAGGGIGSDAFKGWAMGLGADPLSRLAPGADRIVIAGFSAGHGAIEVLLGRAMTDQRIVGLLALDAYYVGWKVSTPKRGYLDWLQVAIARNVPAWLTTSTHHPVQYPSATESIQPLIKALDLQESEVPAALKQEGLPTPLARARGSVVWLNYTTLLPHADHARKLARPALRSGPFFSSVAATSALPASPTSPTQSAASSPSAKASPRITAPKPAPPKVPVSSDNTGVYLGLTLAFGLGSYLLLSKS